MFMTFKENFNTYTNFMFVTIKLKIIKAYFYIQGRYN